LNNILRWILKHKFVFTPFHSQEHMDLINQVEEWWVSLRLVELIRRGDRIDTTGILIPQIRWIQNKNILLKFTMHCKTNSFILLPCKTYCLECHLRNPLLPFWSWWVEAREVMPCQVSTPLTWMTFNTCFLPFLPPFPIFFCLIGNCFLWTNLGIFHAYLL
jgi:hypothetical protein